MIPNSMVFNKHRKIKRILFTLHSAATVSITHHLLKINRDRWPTPAFLQTFFNTKANTTR